MKRAHQLRSLAKLDKRTALGRALHAWRADLVRDLGGAETLTTQQLQVVDLCLRTKLLLDSIDAWLLTQRSLVNQRRRAVYPTVLQRQSLARDLAAFLHQLGLERRGPKSVDLRAYLASRYPGHSPDHSSDHRPDPA